jgi:hypothetical protein
MMTIEALRYGKGDDHPHETQAFAIHAGIGEVTE